MRSLEAPNGPYENGYSQVSGFGLGVPRTKKLDLLKRFEDFPNGKSTSWESLGNMSDFRGFLKQIQKTMIHMSIPKGQLNHEKPLGFHLVFGRKSQGMQREIIYIYNQMFLHYISTIYIFTHIIYIYIYLKNININV